MDVKDKLRILYHIHPEPQRQTAEMDSEYRIKRRDKALNTAHRQVLVIVHFQVNGLLYRFKKPNQRQTTVYHPSTQTDTNQLLFHVCLTSGSVIWCLSACSSRKSNMYLMARGSALPLWAVLKMVSNRSSTNFCNVPCHIQTRTHT